MEHILTFMFLVIAAAIVAAWIELRLIRKHLESGRMIVQVKNDDLPLLVEQA